MGLGVLLGNGNGTLQPSITYSLSDQPNNVAVGDFNHDGNLDVAVGGLVAVFLGNGDGTLLRPLQEFYGGDVFVSDFNGDGNLDMGTQGYPLGVDMYYGKGNGTFEPERLYSTGPNGLALAVGDFNNDQMPDVAFLSPDGDAYIVLNTGLAAFSPASPLMFANQLVDTISPSQVVTLSNVGKKSMLIASITGSGQFKVSSTCGKSLAPAAKCKISAAFAPTKQGNQTGLITIVDSASSKPEAIELSGAATVVTLAPSSLTFAAQKVGTTSPPQQVTLTNTGKIPLSITKWTLHGFDPNEFTQSNNCPSSLNAGGTCTITVTFDPAKTGARSAILYVTDTGGGSPQIVSLSGTGS
jgi:FG-GAP-like repeat/Abnormal spindle-like microcephaly-assoc'd, ASPM-SPD-2-Hydin